MNMLQHKVVISNLSYSDYQHTHDHRQQTTQHILFVATALNLLFTLIVKTIAIFL